MGKEHDAVKADAAEHDAAKGEEGDSGRNVAAAGHQFRQDAKADADSGDEVSKNLTKDWPDRSDKKDVPSKP
jgi:hypothetical protein